MHISVAQFDGSTDLVTIEIASDLTIKDLKAIIASESVFAIQPNEMNLYYNGRLLNDENMTLEQSNLKDYDVVICQQSFGNETGTSAAAIGMRSVFDPRMPEQLLDQLRSNPAALQQIRRSDPRLAEAIERRDINTFMQRIMSGIMGQRSSNPTTVDLLDPRVQQRIEETINMENVQESMEHAYEHAPEFFGNVVMLYINCKINGHPVKAFIDSGAQMTIMSKACAERCGIMRLVDRRFGGIARGVGTQTILGRIHLAQLEVEKQFFATSLAVLEDQAIDMLIGLDMLRRHRCVIDLNKNVLRIENTVETRFLPESELPVHARLSLDSRDADSDDLSEALLRSASESANVRRQQQSAAAAGRTTDRSSATASPFPEKDINKLLKKGFTREQAIEELKLTNGDVTKALVSLMTKSLTKSKRKH